MTSPIGAAQLPAAFAKKRFLNSAIISITMPPAKYYNPFHCCPKCAPSQFVQFFYTQSFQLN